MIPAAAQAFDIYDYLSMPDKPLSIARPDWVNEESHLRLGYEVNEIYREKRDGVKFVDYHGYSVGGELQVNPVVHFAFGLNKRFNGHQEWLNKDKDNLHPFNLHSDNRVNGAFIKLGNEHFRFMYGHSESDERFKGHYDLHEDIIAALGDDPDVTFNTDGEADTFRVYAEYKRFRLSLNAEFSKYKHCVEAPSEELIIDINHDRKVRSREAELSYEAGNHWFPYVRFYDYRDTGDGKDYRFRRDYRYPDEIRFGDGKLYGENQTDFKVVTKTIGTAYEYKHGWYYADYSRVSADLSGHSLFNLVNIDVLFFFTTRLSKGNTWFKPDTGHMGRIGFKRHHRSIHYGMQYSLCKLHGNVGRITEKTKMSGADLNTRDKFKDLRLHRLDVTAARPDKYGSWSIGLKAMFPQVKKHNQTITEPDRPEIAGPHKSIRGGWQITVMREFKL